MRCPTCGYQIDQYNLDRCPNCGNPLPTQAAQPTAENPPPQQPQYYPYPQYSPPPQPGAGPQPFGYPPSGYPPQPPEGNYPQQGAYPPPPHYGYPQPWMPMTQPKTGGGFAIAGLILGIVSIPIALFAICGYITSILGIIFSILGLRAPSKRTMATIGIVLSVLGFIASIVSSIVGVMMMQHQYPITVASNAPTPSHPDTTPVAFPSPTAFGPTVATGTLSFSGSAGDYIAGGESYSYSTSKGDVLPISASSTRSTVSIVVTGYNGDWWTLEFGAPGTVAPINGKPAVLVPGTYSAAHRYPFNGNGPGLALYGNGRGCNTVTGSFTIIYAFFGPQGYVQKFAPTFVQHLEGGTSAARSQVPISHPPSR